MRLRGSRLMPVNQLYDYIVYSVFVCTQPETAGKNYSEFRNGGRKFEF